MTLVARDNFRGRPQLRLVHGSLWPRWDATPWQKVAAAILACTHELAQHLLNQRWVRVDETLRERRELLDCMSRLCLDVDGRRCLSSLEQAVLESERAILAMVGSARRFY